MEVAIPTVVDTTMATIMDTMAIMAIITGEDVVVMAIVTDITVVKQT